MKIKDILTIAAVALMTGSCNSIDEVLSGDRMPINLAATVEGNAIGATRTETANDTQDETLLVDQTVKAVITIDGVENTRNYTVGTSNQLTTDEATLYYPMDGTPVSIYAVHPNYMSAENFTVAIDQRDDAYYAASDLCYSKTASYKKATWNTLTFKHLLSKVIVNVTNNLNTNAISSVQLNAKIRTTLTYPAANDDGYTLADATIPSTVTLLPGAAAIIPPQTVSSGSTLLSFTIPGIGLMEYKLTSDATFLSGHQYTYNVTVDKTGISVTSTITPWGTDDPLGTTSQIESVNYIPLTLEAIENNVTITIRNSLNLTILYSVNGASRLSSNSNPITISLPSAGDKVCLFGDNATYFDNSNVYTNIHCDKNCYLYGNVMSLINSNNFGELKTLTGTYAFRSLFNGSNYNNNYIQYKPGCPFVLPATTLTEGCYMLMFSLCSGLTKSPELPATSLATSCYNQMFTNAGLVEAPELPATTLANSCYENMFRDCANLETAPVLSAGTLCERCYYNMFRGCTNLNYIKMIATDISADKCLEAWVQDISATGTFIRHANMKTLGEGDNGIPANWTVLTATE